MSLADTYTYSLSAKQEVVLDGEGIEMLSQMTKVNIFVLSDKLHVLDTICLTMHCVLFHQMERKARW